MRTYSELISLPTFEERFEYLKLNGVVGAETFGFDRYLNQVLYNSGEWRSLRREIIARDHGCDLAFPDYELDGVIYVHHMNPINVDDIVNRMDVVLNPEYLITTGYWTHRAIHYGEFESIDRKETIRTPNDTCPWRL